MQQFVSNISWECPKCETQNQQLVRVPELDFAAEKSGDMSTFDQIDIVCKNCDTVYFGHVWSSVGDTYFDIEEPEAFTFHGDMPMFWPPEQDYDPPDDPQSIAEEALSHLRTMAGTEGPASDPQFVNRLVFSGAISCFEAFLGDTLIGAFQEDPVVRTSLLTNNPVLGKIGVSAAELALDSDALTKRIVRELRGYLYHNLVTVIELYRDGFGIDIAPEKSDRDILFKAIENRHHCVHRNGNDQSGNKLDLFDKDYVETVISSIEKCIRHIESERTGLAF